MYMKSMGSLQVDCYPPGTVFIQAPKLADGSPMPECKPVESSNGMVILRTGAESVPDSDKSSLWSGIRDCTVGWNFGAAGDWQGLRVLACTPMWLGLAALVWLAWPKGK